ncbi:MAG: TonB-dependent receptor, partial [Myxococcota bacterium]
GSLGADIVSRTKTNNAFNNAATQCAFCGYATPFSQFGDASQLFSGFTPDNFLSRIDANIPRVFPKLNPDAIRAAYAASGENADALTAVADPLASSTVEEIVTGAYLQFDHFGELVLPYALNFGVRVAYTNLTSTGFGNQVGDFTRVVRASDGNNQTFTLSDPIEQNRTNDYFDILPALNLAVDVTDNLIVRLGGSRSLSRPTLTDLSTFFTVASTNVGGEGIIRSNPELEAIRSWNADLSVEWYGRNGSYVGVAGFYKNITDFVTQRIAREQVTINDVVNQQTDGSEVAGDPVTIDFRIQEPQNGDTAEILGLEVGGQYILDFGVGVAANLTLTDSSATSNGVSAPLENISDFAANVSLFFERFALFLDDDTFSVRVSMNHRGDYLQGQTIEGGRNEFVDNFTQFDASLRYDFTQQIGLFFEGINMTDEPIFRFSETRDFLELYEVNGSRWVLGLRGRI